jgi:putative membrane protein
MLAAGAVLTWWLTGAAAISSMPHSYPYLFGAGFIALCAMILPGISGSFMLVVMGQYTYILSAVAHFRVDVLAVFAAGGVLGLMTFSRVLSACFRKFPAATNAFLIGVMAGSLRVVWPWHSGGALSLPPFDGALLHAAGACALGVALPLVVEAIATRK